MVRIVELYRATSHQRRLALLSDAFEDRLERWKYPLIALNPRIANWRRA
jgi:hypothetical protein